MLGRRFLIWRQSLAENGAEHLVVFFGKNKLYILKQTKPLTRFRTFKRLSCSPPND